MKKITTQFLMVVLMVSATAAPSMAASLPVNPVTTATSTEPAPEKVQSALNEFKNLSRHERKERLKDAKKLLKEYKAEKKAGHREDDTNLILLAILAILLPPLAVYLKEGEVNSRFWISLILTLLFWVPGVIFALLVVFDVI